MIQTGFIEPVIRVSEPEQPGACRYLAGNNENENNLNIKRYYWQKVATSDMYIKPAFNINIVKKQKDTKQSIKEVILGEKISWHISFAGRKMMRLAGC